MLGSTIVLIKRKRTHRKGDRSPSDVTTLNPNDLMDDGHEPGPNIRVIAYIHQWTLLFHKRSPTADPTKVIVANSCVRRYRLGRRVIANTMSSEIQLWRAIVGGKLVRRGGKNVDSLSEGRDVGLMRLGPWLKLED